jgi:hypothetical protein
MSTQKWESVTWEWLEREIVDCLLIAGERRGNSESLAGFLARQPKSGPGPAIPKRKQPQEHSHA